MIQDNLKILVIENNKTIRNFIKTNLILNGIRDLRFAENGVEGFSFLKNNEFDLLILNWEAPKLEPTTYLSNIRERTNHEKLPILVLTSEPTKENIQKIIQSGATELVIKPFVIKTILGKIEKIFTAEDTIQTREKNASKQPLICEKMPKIEDFINKKSEILIVDDESNLEIIENILSNNKNYIIRKVDSGPKALQIFASNRPPDIVLLDIMMPKLNGYQVCEHIRENPLFVRIPIIFLTANNDPNSVVKAFNCGGNDFIPKPINPEELIVRLRNQIDLKAAFDVQQEKIDLLMENAHLKKCLGR